MLILGYTTVAILASTTIHVGTYVSAFQNHHLPLKQNTFLAQPSSRLYYSVVDIHENANRDVETMDQWSYGCGVQRADGLQLMTTVEEEGYSPNVDVSFMTTVDMPAESPVLAVPAQMILSSHQAMEEFGRLPEVEKALKSFNAESQLPQYYLMLKIIVEWEKGDESPWYPWLNSLPRYFSNAASMTAFCYKCLPSLMASLAMKERANMNHLQIKRVPFINDDIKGNAHLWIWAYQIVYTRSFPKPNSSQNNSNGDDDLCIVPMADYFNHGTETEISTSYDEEGNCHVHTTKDVPAGSPLRMSYGDPTNPSFLFARYGFLDESSPATFCKIMPAHVSKELVEMGYVHNRMLFYKETGEVSQEVFDVLLHQILSSSNIAKKRQFHQAHLMNDYETKQFLHEQYYHETSAQLLEHIDTFLYQLDQLSSKSIGRDFYEHPRLPLILRHNDFVRNTFLTVRARYFNTIE